MLHRSRSLVAFCTLTMAGSLSAQQQARVAAAADSTALPKRIAWRSLGPTNQAGRISVTEALRRVA